MVRIHKFQRLPLADVVEAAAEAAVVAAAVVAAVVAEAVVGSAVADVVARCSALRLRVTIVSAAAFVDAIAIARDGGPGWTLSCGLWRDTRLLVW